MPSERAWSTDFSSVSSPLMSSRPSSGFWNPEMILIRVDLPAPLSPSRPSTSPFLRCRLMFCRAVTGPKRLATFSTPRTSPLPLASDATAPPDPPDVDVDHHREEDRQTQ